MDEPDEPIDSILNQKEETIDLVKELSPKKTSKYKKALFEFFLINSNNWIKRNLAKLLNISAYCGIGIKQLQFQSLVLLSTTIKTSSSYDTSIQNFLNNIRFDLVFINLTTQDTLTYISLSTVFIPALMFLLIYLQLLAKKRLFIKVFIIIFVSLSWIIENYLMIPIVIYSTIYIQHSFFITDSYVDVYKQNLVFSPLIGILFVIQLILLFVIVVMNTLFNYTSGYSFDTAYSRAHSVVSLKQICFLFFLSIINVAVNKIYFLYITPVVGLFMLYNYFNYLTYYSNFDNLVDSGLWLTLLMSSLLSLINENITEGLETVVCLLTLLPFCYFLLWTSLEKCFEWKIGSVSRSPFSYELRIRGLCKGTEMDEESIGKVRELFDECTKRFVEFKLTYIWECNFEIKYTGNNELAMVKLLKYVFAERRPGFFDKPLEVFRSFPDIEAQFLFYKLLSKLKASRTVKDSELLKHLKNYSKSNLLDFEACNKLVSVIDSNLQSLNTDAKIITKRTVELFNALNDKNITLTKYLKLSDEDTKELISYKSFKDQLFHSTDPNFESQEEKHIENYIEKMMDINSDHKIAKMILSGFPKKIGTIIYINKTCINLLGADDSSEILGKNFTSLILKPFIDMHKHVLEKFLLFGKETEVRRERLIVLNKNGYAIEVTLLIKICFYSQVCYFLIDFLPKFPKENIIVYNSDGEILSFSEELQPIIHPGTNNIENLLPNIKSKLLVTPINTIFEYEYHERSEFLKQTLISIGNCTLYVLHIYEDESFIKSFTSHSTRAFRRRSVSILSGAAPAVLKRKPSFNKRKVKSSESSFVPIQSKSQDWSLRINKIARFLVISNFQINLLVACIILVLTVSEINMSDSDSLCQIVEDLGYMRGHVLGIASDARSIDLSKYSEAVIYDLSYYEASLSNHSSALEQLLLGLDTYTDVFPIAARLKDTQIQVVQCFSSSCTLQNTNLYQGIILLNSAVNKWLVDIVQNQDSLLFIYNNAFFSLFSELNNTIFVSLTEIEAKTTNFFGFLQNIKTVIFAPLALLLIFNLVSLFMLSKINVEQWEYISDISTSSLLAIRSKAKHRMKILIKSHVTLSPEIERKAKVFQSFWKKYILGFFFLVLILFLYWVLMIYCVEGQLKFISQLRLDHSFWGGLRRSLVNFIFIWSRELYLKDTNYSYTKIVTGYVKFPSAEQIFNYQAESLMYIENHVITQTLSLNRQNYDFQKYLNYLAGSPCTDLSLAGCGSSIISQGIHPALLMYKSDLEVLVNSLHTPNSSILWKAEQDETFIFSALSTSILNFKAQSLTFNTFYTNISIALCCTWILLLVVSFKFLQKDRITDMKLALLSRNKLIMLIHDTRLAQTQQSLNDQLSQFSSNTVPK